MTKPRKPKHISKADWDAVDVPALSKAEFSRARPLREVLPQLAAWSRRQRAGKGDPHKQAVSIRLSPEVIAFFKRRGPGWQTRIDRALRAFVEAAE